MTTPTDAELRAIVERVVRRTLGEAPLPASPHPERSERSEQCEAKPTNAAGDSRRGGGPVAIGADHGGYPLKETLRAYLTGLGYSLIDCGAASTDPVDYPDFAYAVARLVSEGAAWRGIVIDGAGIGSAMAANKVPGVRAALCYDYATAVNSREHNDANVLTLGAGLIGPALARQIAETWLATEFGGGRHAKRVDKIMEIERRFLKG